MESSKHNTCDLRSDNKSHPSQPLTGLSGCGRELRGWRRHSRLWGLETERCEVLRINFFWLLRISSVTGVILPRLPTILNKSERKAWDLGKLSVDPLVNRKQAVSQSSVSVKPLCTNLLHLFIVICC